MLDLTREDFQLQATSGKSQLVTVETQHLPILQQGYDYQWQEPQAPDAGQQYLRYSRFQERHIVVDLPVAPKLYDSIAPVQTGLQQRYRQPTKNEFSHIRYTPVTYDPADFIQEQYCLRPRLFTRPRQIEICIGITMYNEDEYLLGLTLEALHRDIKLLQESSRAEPWGPDSWQKIVVCIISDGRAKINDKTKALLASLGVYEPAGMLASVDGRDVVSHLFEYTTHGAIRIDGTQVSVELGSLDAVPCQTILCLKEKNQKKINSHRWFLMAISRYLQPTVCMFLDAGSVPQPNSLYRMWEPLSKKNNVAATTGFCRTLDPSRIGAIINPLVGYQTFEYQLTNALERPVESVFGRRFTLNKGGFAAYRYSVVVPDRIGEGAFTDYFQGEKIVMDNTITKANSFLAEDRAISAGLLRTDLKVWRTISVDSAEVAVDLPLTMGEMILQRRRWINGDLYSTLHEVKHTLDYVQRRPWSVRSLGLLVGTLYQIVILLLQFFAIGNFFAMFCVITTSMSNEAFLGRAGEAASRAMSYLYVFVFLVGLVCCMGNRPQTTRLYAWLSFAWMLLYCYFFAILLYLIIKGSQHVLKLSQKPSSMLITEHLFLYLVWPLVIIVVVWLIAPLTLLRKPHSISSCIWYSLFLPVHMNLLSTYAWCNSHDITWGTRGDSVERLPSVQVRREQDLSKETDPQTGDLIFRSYNDYLSRLDECYEMQRQHCETKIPDKAPTRHKAEMMEDYFKMFRTLTLTLWLGLNSALVMIVVNVPSISKYTPTADGGHGLVFVGVVLWAYAGLAGFQYCCTILYALGNLWSYVREKSLAVLRRGARQGGKEVGKV